MLKQSYQTKHSRPKRQAIEKVTAQEDAETIRQIMRNVSSRLLDRLENGLDTSRGGAL